VLVALPSDEARPDCDTVAQALRSRGIPTEVAASPQKYGRQIRYAERRGIPYVWFPGAPHEVKDIRSGNQVVADPASWLPPQSDLRPQVITQKVFE
jgi:histidyl-tRNA synthetase